MDKIANYMGEKIGDYVEDVVKNALGAGDKDKDKDDKKGGIFSIFGDDDKEKEKEKDKGGLFSFGNDKKTEDEDKGGFFSKIFDRDDDDKEKDKKIGFKGLFNEQGGAAGGDGGQTAAGSQGGCSVGTKGQSIGVNDGDLLNDLMDVAEETAKGN